MWDGDSFNLYAVPNELADSADLTDPIELRNAAIATYALTPAADGRHELSINDTPNGSAIQSLLKKRDLLEDAGTPDKPYTRVSAGYTANRVLTQEVVRRLALNIGRTPVVYYPQRDTGARAGRPNSGRDFTADDVRNQFSRAQPGRTGVPMQDAKAIVAAIREAMPTAPAINVHDSVKKAPENLRRLIRQAGADNDVEAVYHDGEIHVFPGNIASIERMQFVVAHHEVRHHGLRSMLGPQMGPAMLRMYASNPNLKAAADAKMAAGLADTRILAVEEALADMPVEELQALTGWARIVAAARQWLRQAAAKLRRAGLNTLADAMEPDGWTDNDIAALVQRAEDVSRGGAAPFSTGGSAVFQRAYHGTPYRGIERFSTDAIGTGEGAQAYGWGLYFASKREVADFYRRKLSGESDRVFTKDGRTIQGPTELAEAYYQPGRIVRGYSGADKVLEFKRTDNGGWAVKVVGVKASGDPMESERPRWHATQPGGNDLRDAL
nr:hypothetical protein [Burkholderiaceae bacterium]